MKASPKKLLPLTVVAIAVTSLFSVRPAQGGYIVTLEQVGANVVANGSGPIDLNGLMFEFTSNVGAGVEGSLGIINTGPQTLPSIDVYGGFTGPTSFGSGGGFLADTGSGDFVVMQGFQFLLAVPQGYVSGSALSDSMTFNNQTLASMGVTPGTYEWTWGDGGANQNFTLVIGAVPDGGTTISLLGCALLGLAVLRRKLGC